MLSRHVFRQFVLVSISLATCLPGLLAAETLVLEATADYWSIDAGEVPYYAEPARGSLAIDAARVDYRDKFARAITNFPEASGFYDITLSALGELDGEAEYRLLINDVLVGTATNPEVTTDYTPVSHLFSDVVVPAGAMIAVESLANTNGRIPEGDGTAYARGRWTALEFLALDTVVTPEQVDMSVSVSASKESVLVGDTFELNITVSNSQDSAVATAPVITVTFPDAEIGAKEIGDCVQSGNKITCELAEMAADTSVSLALTLQGLLQAPSILIQTSISADQEDTQESDNTTLTPMTVNSAEVTTDAPVEPDTAVDSTDSTDSSSTGDTTTASTVDMEADSDASGSGSVEWLLLSALLYTLAARRAIRHVRLVPCAPLQRSVR